VSHHHKKRIEMELPFAIVWNQELADVEESPLNLEPAQTGMEEHEEHVHDHCYILKFIIVAFFSLIFCQSDCLRQERHIQERLKERKDEPIPIPIIRVVPEYDGDNAADFVRPSTYVLFDPTNYNLPEAHIEYDADDDDAAFIAQYNASGTNAVTLDDTLLERIVDMFEKERALLDRRKLPYTLDVAVEKCEDVLNEQERQLVPILYPYWLAKRAARKERPLLERFVPAPPRDEPSPFIPFRPRERVRPPPLRKDDLPALERMQALRNDLDWARRIVTAVLKREKLRKMRLDSAHEHWRLVQIAAKWHASTAAGLLERRQRARTRDAPSLFATLERIRRGEFVDAAGVLRFTDPDYASDDDDGDDEERHVSTATAASAASTSDLDANERMFDMLRTGEALFGYGLVDASIRRGAAATTADDAAATTAQTKPIRLGDVSRSLAPNERAAMLRSSAVPLAVDAPWLEPAAPAPPPPLPLPIDVSLPLRSHATQSADDPLLVPWPLEPDRLFAGDDDGDGVSQFAFYGRPRVARGNRLVFDRVRPAHMSLDAGLPASLFSGGSDGRYVMVRPRSKPVRLPLIDGFEDDEAPTTMHTAFDDDFDDDIVGANADDNDDDNDDGDDESTVAAAVAAPPPVLMGEGDLGAPPPEMDVLLAPP
jgi:hypothetical protein